MRSDDAPLVGDASGAPDDNADHAWLLNPFARIQPEPHSTLGGRRLAIFARRRTVGITKTVVDEAADPQLFALLLTLTTAGGDLEVELDELLLAALRDMGLLVLADEVAAAVRLCIAPEGGTEDDHGAALVVHPSLRAAGAAALELSESAVATPPDRKTHV